MKLRDYISSKEVTLCFLGIGLLLLCLFMGVAEADILLIVVMSFSILLTTIAWLIVSWYLDWKKIKKLERIRQELPEKYLLGEVLPLPTNIVEKQYYEIIKTISRSAIGIAEQAKRDKEEYCDYVESWIHEIKTPLTAASLILANDADVQKLKKELKRADNLTESILYYARMRTAEKDTQIKEVYVAKVMEASVKSQMELLIAAGISVELSGDFTVYTDAKALEFIIKQLLINCAKYCQGCQIIMTAEGGVLMVEDNGIGIPKYDITRVTERGFTGINGRRIGGSTGMGLYIVGELCERLGITLEIESAQSEYTCVRLSFNSLTKL